MTICNIHWYSFCRSEAQNESCEDESKGLCLFLEALGKELLPSLGGWQNAVLCGSSSFLWGDSWGWPSAPTVLSSVILCSSYYDTSEFSCLESLISHWLHLSSIISSWLTLLPSTYAFKASCDYTGQLKVIQDNLPMVKSAD